MRDVIPLIAAFQNPNVKAFARTVRFCEGTPGDDGYSIIFGGGHFAGLDGIPGTFDDFADHPRKVVTRTMKGKIYKSSAAGAYQWMPPSWDEIAALYGLKDFSPANQDIGFVGLLIKRHALEDVTAGRFEAAIKKCCWEWASLPGSPYGQPIKTIEVCKAEYEKWGGAYSTVPDPTPMPVRTGEPPNQKRDMAPFIAMALPALFNVVPELIKQFGNGSAMAERNAKAAETVVNVAKEALGAKNEQELVEQIQNDPAAAATVRKAVQDNWFQIVEVGGGIQAAREAAVKMQGDKGLLGNPAFIISLILLIYPTMLLTDVFWFNPDQYSADGLRTQIVTGVLLVISIVAGFWLGTSFSSGKKDDTIKTLAGQ